MLALPESEELPDVELLLLELPELELVVLFFLLLDAAEELFATLDAPAVTLTVCAAASSCAMIAFCWSMVCLYCAASDCASASLLPKLSIWLLFSAFSVSNCCCCS